MFFGYNVFENRENKENKRKNPIIEEIKCEKTNIWAQDILKIHIEISSLFNILNKLDLDRKTLLSYLTTEIIDLDPYRLPYTKYFKLRINEPEKFTHNNIINLNKNIIQVENILGLQNQNQKKKIWVEEENVVNNVEDFIRNRFYENLDLKIFLLKHLNHERRKYKLILNKDTKNIIIEQGIKRFKPNKKILKKLKGFIVNVKGVQINLSKSSIGMILKQSHIKENTIIKHITFFTKHLKQNYQITIKYHTIIYPKKLKKKLDWINDKPDLSKKIKRKNISKFDNLIENAENYYNMLIEDENRRLREIGLIPFKRSKSCPHRVRLQQSALLPP